MLCHNIKNLAWKPWCVERGVGASLRTLAVSGDRCGAHPLATAHWRVAPGCRVTCGGGDRGRSLVGRLEIEHRPAHGGHGTQLYAVAGTELQRSEYQPVLKQYRVLIHDS